MSETRPVGGPGGPAVAAADALRVAGLRKSFGGLRAVDDVSFSVREGALAAIIGPNGAGKSTLFNLLTNLYRPDGGRAFFSGRDLSGRTPDEIAAMGLVRTFQTARVFPGMTVLDNVLIGAHLRSRAHIWEQALWLPPARREEGEIRACARAVLEVAGLGRIAGAPARGQPIGVQKLIELSRALMARPRVLLLDEPAAGLNDAETDDLARLILGIRAAGVTVVVVEHNMSLVMSIAETVIVLDRGRVIAAGAPAAIQQDPRVIDAYLGVGQGAR